MAKQIRAIGLKSRFGPVIQRSKSFSPSPEKKFRYSRSARSTRPQIDQFKDYSLRRRAPPFRQGWPGRISKDRLIATPLRNSNPPWQTATLSPVCLAVFLRLPEILASSFHPLSHRHQRSAQTLSPPAPQSPLDRWLHAAAESQFSAYRRNDRTFRPKHSPISANHFASAHLTGRQSQENSTSQRSALPLWYPKPLPVCHPLNSTVWTRTLETASTHFRHWCR